MSRTRPARMTAGRIYVQGTVLPVPAGELTGVPMTGDVRVGVRLQRTTVTHEEDPSLLGLHPRHLGGGRAGRDPRTRGACLGSARRRPAGDVSTRSTCCAGGTVIDQKEPAALTGVLKHIADL